jgi:hypothetical protein
LPTLPSSLDDRYRLRDTVGWHGDLVTVSATDEILERSVWITLLVGADETSALAYRHRAEALASRRVHAGVRVYDGSMDLPLPYIVTERAEEDHPGALLALLSDAEATGELPARIAAPPQPAPPVDTQTAPVAAVPDPTPRLAVLWSTAAAIALLLIGGIVSVSAAGETPAQAADIPVVETMPVDPVVLDPALEHPEPDPAEQVQVEPQPAPAPPPAPERAAPARGRSDTGPPAHANQGGDRGGLPGNGNGNRVDGAGNGGRGNGR